jgi:hypothetical protein
MSAPIPEVEQVKALQQVADVGEERRRLMAELDAATERLRPLVIAAVQAGADRSRVIELAGISSPTLYAWVKEAGVTVGKPRGRTGNKPARKTRAKGK